MWLDMYKTVQLFLMKTAYASDVILPNRRHLCIKVTHAQSNPVFLNSSSNIYIEAITSNLLLIMDLLGSILR